MSVQEQIAELRQKLRPEPWEDDLSRNTLDTEPFEALPPVSERPEEEWKPVADNANANLMQGIGARQRMEADTYPIPAPQDREGYSPGRDVQYWMSGLVDHLKIMQACRELNIDVQRYFDFGCASGRVIRHFVAQTEIPEIWGSDINQRHIRWLYEHMPKRVKPIFNHTIPAIPLEDNYFDVVSAFSVFTHIDTFETAWLAELRRILKPGGLAYLTVHNEDTWEVLRGEINNDKNRLIQQVRKVDPQFDQHIMGPLPNTRTVYRFTSQGPYRAQVFHSNDYLHNVWGRYFDLIKILPRHHVRQTVVLLRKPS
ncbi:MAG: class I SAM-dependent methyltransferase [Pirellulaceae bacterium]